MRNAEATHPGGLTGTMTRKRVVESVVETRGEESGTGFVSSCSVASRIARRSTRPARSWLFR